MLSGDKSNVRKLIGSLREAIKAGERESSDKNVCQLVLSAVLSFSDHGSALTTFATDLVQTGAAMCAAEPVLGNCIQNTLQEAVYG